MAIADQASGSNTPFRQELQALLFGDAVPCILGTIILLSALVAIAVFLLRRKPKARLLLWFGQIALLYGVRLLATSETLHLLFEIPDTFWRQLIGLITYVILIPFVLFIEEIYGRGWKSSLRVLLWIQTVYAVAAILSDFLHRSPESFPDPVYLFFLGLGTVLLLGRLFAYRPSMSEESRTIFVGLGLFVLSVVNEHLVALGVAPWSARLEALGFSLFVVFLGYVAARRSFAQERKLADIQREMDAAWRIQSSILPRQLPTIDGCRLAVRYVPVAAVAGDFYDFAVLGDARLGILIADVAGHGVPAALIASMVKVAFSSQFSCWSDPAALVAGLNQVLCGQRTGQFVTAGYLLLDLNKTSALYSGAAHPPLLLWRRAERKILDFQENGLMLGFRPDEKYASIPIRLTPGDRILMYTDGIIEATNPAGEYFGEERFRESIIAGSHFAADRFADSLLLDLAEWTRKSARANGDDLTLIVVDIA